MNNSSPALFATRLSALRRERHWKQEAIAIHVGVTRSAYTKWETGVACPRFEELCKLAELFRVSTDYLLGVSPAPLPTSSPQAQHMAELFCRLPLEEQQRLLMQAGISVPE